MTPKLFYRTTFGQHNADCQTFRSSHFIACDPTVTSFDDSTPIVVQIEGSEVLHSSLQENAQYHTMALLVAGSTLCPDCVSALSGYGIVSTDTMWTGAKKLGAVHAGLKPTRF